MNLLLKKYCFLSAFISAAFLGGCTTQPGTDFFSKTATENIITLMTIQESDYDNSVQIIGPKIINHQQSHPLEQTLYLISNLDIDGKTVVHQMFIEQISVIPTETLSTWQPLDRADINAGVLLMASTRSAEKLSCSEHNCLYRESLLLNVTKQQLRQASRFGLKATLHAASDRSEQILIPANYVKAYVATINRTLSPRGLVHARMTDINDFPVHKKYPRGFAEAENAAKSMDCNYKTLKTIAAEGPRSTFQVECANHQLRQIQCQWGICEVLR